MTTTAPALTAITLTVNGKDFIVGPPHLTMGSNVGAAYYTYHSTRDGKRFGPCRTADDSGGAKSVGRQLAVAARNHFGPEVVDARLAALIAAQIERLRNHIAEIDPEDRWAESNRAFYGEQLAALEAVRQA